MADMHDTSVYDAWRLAEDDPRDIIGVLPLLLGQGQIVRGRADDLTYTDVWMYPTLLAARAWYEAWYEPAHPEPKYWTRHTSVGKPTRRRYYDEDGALIREEECE